MSDRDRILPVLNAMTVDVEDYFHVSVFERSVPRSRWESLESRVCANTGRLLELFDDCGVRATFFVLGWVAERFPQLIRRIRSTGHEIASHGYAHGLVYRQTRDAFREDVRRAKAVIEATTGAAVVGYRAPSYSITVQSLWALDVLIEEGLAYDSSIYPIHHDRYGLPGSPLRPYVIERPSGSIVEVPGTTVRVGPVTLPVGGGGYFRLFPYGWTRWGLRRINRQSQRAIFYLHPWELDSEQPRLATSVLGRFRHYRNLDKTEHRLRALLRDFRFGPVWQVLDDMRGADGPAAAAASISPTTPARAFDMGGV